MTVGELIERLQVFDKDLEVVYTYDDIYGHPYEVTKIKEHEWKNDDKGSHYIATGKYIVVIE